MSEGGRLVRTRRVGFEKDRGVLEVRQESGLSFFRLELDGRQVQDGLVLRVLRPLAERNVSTRFVKMHPDCLSFVALGEHLPACQDALSGVGVPLQVVEGCAVVTVVAPDMRSIPGLMARMGEALCAHAIEVYQTADSHSSVSCVIPAERLVEAVAALRGEFGLAEEAV